MTSLDLIYIDSIVRAALVEDIGSGDITTALTVPEMQTAMAKVLIKAPGIICGLQVFRAAFAALDAGVSVELSAEDGDMVSPDMIVATVSGSARSILTGERVALNLLQRMSGVATVTARYVALVAGTKARIVDTRKTTPGLRRLEKYAVTCGGGRNHRFGLSDGILIKDNHIAAAGGIKQAVSAAKRQAPHTLKIEVEVSNTAQLEEALVAGADAILLDNMGLEPLAECVSITGCRVPLEASGGVDESTVASIAQTGVDLISVGALTHSVRAMDISLNFV